MVEGKRIDPPVSDPNDAKQSPAAVAAPEQDPFVRELIERFDATLEEASVKPL